MAPAYSFRPAWTSRVLHSSRTAWIILGVSLVLTAIAWHLSNRYVVARAGERFNYRSEDVEKAIATRMTNYEQVLRSGVALFNSGGEPSREQWRRFVASLDLERNYPGIQGVGYSKVIPANGRAAHVAAVRAEGYPGYSMRPDGDREIYTSIVYLEPFVARNLRAFGFDMYSEATRRAAMSRARDGGAAAISGGVTLVQEDGKDPQKGFLMYLPVYRNGAAPATEAERREALLGWVYAPFRIKDLMHGILGNNYDDIDFTIHDGVIAKEDALLYSSVPPSVTPRPFDSEKDFTRALKLVTAGHTWTVTYVGRDFIAADDSLFSALVALGGVLIDVLLFLTIAQMSAQKREVEREVVARSAELRQRTADITALFELSPDGFVILRDARPGDRTSGLVEHVNPAFERLTGISADALVGRGAAELDDLLARRCLREAERILVPAESLARNLAQASELVLLACLNRRETRSAHYRLDCPARDDANWAHSVTVRRDGDRGPRCLARSDRPRSAPNLESTGRERPCPPTVASSRRRSSRTLHWARPCSRRWPPVRRAPTRVACRWPAGSFRFPFQAIAGDQRQAGGDQRRRQDRERHEHPGQRRLRLRRGLAGRRDEAGRGEDQQDQGRADREPHRLPGGPHAGERPRTLAPRAARVRRHGVREHRQREHLHPGVADPAQSDEGQDRRGGQRPREQQEDGAGEEDDRGGRVPGALAASVADPRP